MGRRPNKPAAPNPATAFQLRTGRQGRGVAEPGRSMKTKILRATCLVLAALLLSTVCGCKPRSQNAVLGSPGNSARTNAFYLQGLAEGRKHAKERPSTSLMVFPTGSTNWSKESMDLYRAGYIAGLGNQ